MEGETITLVLEDNHFEVDKTKLINKSHYFKCLFSPSFYYTPKKEHIINYSIDPFTLQNFIEWIHNDKQILIDYNYNIKSSMIKYQTDNIIDLLNLLELASLFVVDDLINDITETIIQYWLNSDEVIDIWLLADDLALQTLSDICLSVCLDRFMDIPISYLIELPIKNFKQLFLNNNIRADRKYLFNVYQKWISFNDSTNYNIQIDMSKERQIDFLQYVIGYKLENNGNKKEYICCWDNNKFSKVVAIKQLKICGKDLIGHQITGRGFSIYLVGGEYGLGTGQFNEVIWRYCLIANNWYYFARFPYSRRHMVLGFIENCLIVAGGVSRHRVKVLTVLILNIHTGEWKQTANIPEWFTEVPPHTFVKNKLLLLQTSLNIFDFKLESWKTVTLNNINMTPRNRSSLIVYGIVIFMIKNNGKVLHKIHNVQEKICDNCLQVYRDYTMVHTTDDEYLLEEEFISGIGVISILSKVCKSCNYSYLQTNDETRKVSLGLTLTPRLGNFYTINPRTLHCITT